MRICNMGMFNALVLAGVLTPLSSVAHADVIETVVVTAEKRAEDVQSVPISMNVFEQRRLEQFNISDLQSLQNSVPGMVVHTSPVNNGIYIRGFGSAPSNAVFDQSVSVYQDGIYFGLARQAMAPFFDVARIEVLRGPQGGLLGKNTAAGAISIVTADPTAEFEGSATSSYNFDRSGVESFGYVSGPLTDQLGARVAVRFSNLGGYMPNSGTGQRDPRANQALGRLTLRYQPTGNFDIETKFEYGDDSTYGSSSELISPSVYQKLTGTRNATDGFAVAPTNGEYSHHHGYNSATVANLQLGDFAVRSITGFSGFSSRKNSFAAPLNPEHFDILWPEEFNQQSEELQLLSPTAGTFEYILGAYIDRSSHTFGQDVRYNIFGGFFNGRQHSHFTQAAYSWSVFASATVHITEELKLQGSVRYTRIGKAGSFTLFSDFGLPLLGPPHSVQGKIGEGHFDPSITVQYNSSPDVMFYATYAKGSKGGGFDPSNNTVVAANFTFKPEKSTNYEIGAKANLLSNRLTLDIAAFILQFKNLQVSGYNPTTVSLSTTNAASATSKGVEASLAWQALDNLQFSASGAYTYAAFDNYPGAPCKATQPSPPCTPATNNIAGTVLQFTPRWSGQLQADYSTKLSSDLVLGVIVDANYRSSIWLDDGNYSPAIGRQPGVTKIDARMQIAGSDDKWDVALIGKNLTGILTRSYAYNWPLEFGPGGAPLAVAIDDEGRSLALQGTIHF